MEQPIKLLNVEGVNPNYHADDNQQTTFNYIVLISP